MVQSPMSFNSSTSRANPNLNFSPYFFLGGLHFNWNPSSATVLSSVTSTGLDILDYGATYNLTRLSLAFFQHLVSTRSFVPSSFYFYLGPSFSPNFSVFNKGSPRSPSLIFGNYLAGLFSNFSRLRKLSRFSHFNYPPRAVFLIDTKRANPAPNELIKLQLPLGALCSSAVNPFFINYPVPSNYSIQSMVFFFNLFFSSVMVGRLRSSLSPLLKFISRSFPRPPAITDSLAFSTPAVKVSDITPTTFNFFYENAMSTSTYPKLNCPPPYSPPRRRYPVRKVRKSRPDPILFFLKMCVSPRLFLEEPARYCSVFQRFDASAVSSKFHEFISNIMFSPLVSLLSKAFLETRGFFNALSYVRGGSRSITDWYFQNLRFLFSRFFSFFSLWTHFFKKPNSIKLTDKYIKGKAHVDPLLKRL